MPVFHVFYHTAFHEARFPDEPSQMPLSAFEDTVRKAASGLIADDGSVVLSCPAPAAIQVRSPLNSGYGKTVQAHTHPFLRSSRIHTV